MPDAQVCLQKQARSLSWIITGIFNVVSSWLYTLRPVVVEHTVPCLVEVSILYPQIPIHINNNITTHGKLLIAEPGEDVLVKRVPNQVTNAWQVFKQLGVYSCGWQPWQPLTCLDGREPTSFPCLFFLTWCCSCFFVVCPDDSFSHFKVVHQQYFFGIPKDGGHQPAQQTALTPPSWKQEIPPRKKLLCFDCSFSFRLEVMEPKPHP